MRFISFLALLTPFSLAVCQQHSPAAVKHPTAVQVASHAIAAMGGAGLLTYQDSTGRGTATIYGIKGAQTYPVVLQSKGGTGVRQEVQKPSGTDTSVSNGSAGCLKRPGHAPYLIDVVNLHAQRVDYIPALSLLAEYDRNDMNVQYAGTDTVDGQVVDVIALSFSLARPPSGFDPLKVTQHLFFVNQLTGMVAKAQFSWFSDDGPSSTVFKTEVYFSNYQSVQGVAVPFSVTTIIDGKPASDLTLSSIVFNTGLEDSLFDTTCGVENAR